MIGTLSFKHVDKLLLASFMAKVKKMVGVFFEIPQTINLEG
jgi:hypothetical protein